MGDRGQIVGDEQIGDTEPPLEIAQQVEDLGADRHIEGRHRLVEDDHPRREGESTRDGDALALPAGELVRKEADRALGQPDHVEQLEHATPAGGPVERLVDHERLGDDGADAHARVEGSVRILEDRLHRAPVASEPGPPEGENVLSLEADAAARRLC